MLVTGSAAIWYGLMLAFDLPSAALVMLALDLAPLLLLESGSSPGLLIRDGVRVLAFTQHYLVWHNLLSGIAPDAGPEMPGLLAWSAPGIPQEDWSRYLQAVMMRITAGPPGAPMSAGMRGWQGAMMTH